MAQGVKEMSPVLGITVAQNSGQASWLSGSSNRHQGYTIGLVVRFVDRDALERYGPHPEHVPVKEYVSQVCSDVIAVDYEI